jgi:FkbM family methyltransferase
MSRIGSFIAGMIAMLAQMTEFAVAIFRPSSAGRVRGGVIDRLSCHVVSVHHNGTNMRFYAPNWLTNFRAASFADKEPDTLSWIDGFRPDDVFWDVGANVGIYSVYAALKHPRLRVFSFEPSVFNLELLVRNLHSNGLSDRSVVIPMPLSNAVAVARFQLSDVERGSAHSAFGVDYGQDGRTKAFASFYSVPGTTIDTVAAQYQLPPPNHIKLDVDGIEHLILMGASRTLLEPTLRSVLVETDENFTEHYNTCCDILGKSGFVPTDSFQQDMAREKHVHANSIWIRPD